MCKSTSRYPLASVGRHEHGTYQVRCVGMWPLRSKRIYSNVMGSHYAPIQIFQYLISGGGGCRPSVCPISSPVCTSSVDVGIMYHSGIGRLCSCGRRGHYCLLRDKFRRALTLYSSPIYNQHVDRGWTCTPCGSILTRGIFTSSPKDWSRSFLQLFLMRG